jgi:hypothetical protein
MPRIVPNVVAGFSRNAVQLRTKQDIIVVLIKRDLFVDQHHPGRSFQRLLRDIFLMSRPPLLS